MSNNKYLAYWNLSSKTLISPKSIMLGFILNVIFASIAVTYILIFEPNLSFLANTSNVVGDQTSSLILVNIFAFIIVFFLFSNVAAIMQSVIDDRDSKVSEIINTSITEKHYIVGKLGSSLLLILTLMGSALGAFGLAMLVFSFFNPYDFQVYNDVISPILGWSIGDNMMTLLGKLLLFLLVLATSILIALGFSIKVNNVAESAPVALIVLAPYFLLFGLLIFLPSDDITLWVQISAVMMFVPLISPIFLWLFVLIEGFNLLSFIAIIFTTAYLILLFIGVRNIYSYAFYVREKISLSQLLKISIIRKEL